jgi:ATP-dependent DNA helicase RecG
MTRDAEVKVALRAIASGSRAADVESQTLEFKEEITRSVDDTTKMVVEATLCLANSGGGAVVVGVSDKATGADAFVGTTLEIDRLRRRIWDLTKPALVVDIEEERSTGKRLLVVYVPQCFDIHSDTQGRAPQRIGRDCVPMDPTQQLRLREERLGFDWSAQQTDLSVQDASREALASARALLRAQVSGDRRRLAASSDDDLLRALGVVTEKGSLSRAGELLFCEAPSGARPAILYQHRLTPGGEPRAVQRVATPLVLAFARTMDLVQVRSNIAPVTLPDGQQLQLEDFPELAVREALANAVIHRDYHLGEPVHVDHSPELFVVTSPGPLVSGVTPENILTHPSKPRNPALAQAVRVLGLAEEVGRGVDRMYREMIRSGRDLPRIETTHENVRVVLVGGAPNTSIARFVAQLPEEERDDTDTLLVLFRLCATQTIRASEIAILLQKSASEAETVLRRLSTDSVGVIEPTRESARRSQPNYRLRAAAVRSLGTAIPYRRRTLDDIDRKIIAHLREYPTITNRTIQNILDVDIQRAKNILKDLVDRKVLTKVSDHERGPGVEYGHGPKFPPPESRGKRKRA